MQEPILGDMTPDDVMAPAGMARGAVPRDYAVDPPTMFDPPSSMTLIPRSEWSERIRDMEASKSRISDILRAANIPSMDQGPNGYCWGHSTVGCVQAVRAINGSPYVPLSAYMVCAIIKRGRNEGGWCGLSAKFLREVGVCSQALWPQGDRNTRRDTPEVRADAAKYKVTEEWVDLTRDVFDQNLAFEQSFTCLMNRVPTAEDFNHWAHSVMMCDPVDGSAQRATYRAESGKIPDVAEFDRVWGMNNPVTGGFAKRLRNSWGDRWGDLGFGILTGNKAISDGALAIRVVGN